MARGERVLARIFAAGLVERGLPGRFVDAAEVIFATHKLGALWPDFDRMHLWRAVENYARRDRRFGAAVDAAAAAAASGEAR